MDIDPNIIPMPARTVFCHPDNKHWIKENVLADDISIVTTMLLAIDHYIATEDIVCKPKINCLYDADDFANNKITIVTTHTFE